MKVSLSKKILGIGILGLIILLFVYLNIFNSSSLVEYISQEGLHKILIKIVFMIIYFIFSLVGGFCFTRFTGVNGIYIGFSYVSLLLLFEYLEYSSLRELFNQPGNLIFLGIVCMVILGSRIGGKLAKSKG